METGQFLIFHQTPCSFWWKRSRPLAVWWRKTANRQRKFFVSLMEILLTAVFHQTQVSSRKNRQNTFCKGLMEIPGTAVFHQNSAFSLKNKQRISAGMRLASWWVTQSSTEYGMSWQFCWTWGRYYNLCSVNSREMSTKFDEIRLFEDFSSNPKKSCSVCFEEIRRKFNENRRPELFSSNSSKIRSACSSFYPSKFLPNTHQTAKLTQKWTSTSTKNHRYLKFRRIPSDRPLPAKLKWARISTKNCNYLWFRQNSPDRTLSPV